MVWTPGAYAELVRDARVRLCGWPTDVPFENLSDMVHSRRITKRLQALWDLGALAWEKIPKDVSVTEELTSIGLGLPSISKPRAARKDVGGTHKRRAMQAMYPRSGAKSTEFVTEADESDPTELEGEHGPLRVAPLAKGARRQLEFKSVEIIDESDVEL